MKKINFVLLLLQCLSAATAQQPYSKAVREQIAWVETSLSGGIIIDGKLYTLSERMKHYNVPGLKSDLPTESIYYLINTQKL